jgi:hypothetical protein
MEAFFGTSAELRAWPRLITMPPKKDSAVNGRPTLRIQGHSASPENGPTPRPQHNDTWLAVKSAGARARWCWMGPDRVRPVSGAASRVADGGG